MPGIGVSLVAPTVESACKFDPWVREEPLKKEMASHSSILAWRIPWTEELGG